MERNYCCAVSIPKLATRGVYYEQSCEVWNNSHNSVFALLLYYIYNRRTSPSVCEASGNLISGGTEVDGEEGTTSGAPSVNTTDDTGRNTAATVVSNFIPILILILFAH